MRRVHASHAGAHSSMRANVPLGKSNYIISYLCVQINGGVVYGGCGSLHRYTDDARAAKEGYRTSGGNLPGDRGGLIRRTM